MDMQAEGLLPFRVGQLAESRTFQSGFRSAWFRCKIKEIRCKSGNIDFALEFYDFPDDKAKWTRVYQVPQIGRKRARKVEKVLMVRPQYPPICNESEVVHADTISEVKVVRNGVWNVGDLVDWWTDGCYWCARVTKILVDDKVQIELPLPPTGQGGSYEALCNDLRPSLDWSPKHGWSVLISQEGEENYHPCARLIMPFRQAAGIPIGTVDVGIQNVGATAGSMLDASFPSLLSTNALLPVNKSEQPITKEPAGQPLSIAITQEEAQRPQPKTDLDMSDSARNKSEQPITKEPAVQPLSIAISQEEAQRPQPNTDLDLSDSARNKSEQPITKEPGVQPLSIAITQEEAQRPQPNTDLDLSDSAFGETGLPERSGHVEEAGIPLGEDQYYSGGSAKKMRTGGISYFNSMRSDTIEAPIMALEELVNKVKWLKAILESGVPSPNARRPPWKFVEHYGSSGPD